MPELARAANAVVAKAILDARRSLKRINSNSWAVIRLTQAQQIDMRMHIQFAAKPAD